jgi:hypothetical protein
MRYKFYPKLVRRAKYLTKNNGKFYVYARYRDEIGEDCLRRCVYCDAHEEDVGGDSVMELDHFRPISFTEFKHLTNDPQNLHYSCRSCNNLKREYWPARGTAKTYVGTDGFVDPFLVNRLDYFSCQSNGQIKAKTPPAAYMIGLLGLDRPFMRRLRQKRILMSQITSLAEHPGNSSKAKDSKARKANAAKLERLILKLVTLEKRRSS